MGQSKSVSVTVVNPNNGTTTSEHLSAQYFMAIRPLTASELADVNLSAGGAATAIYCPDRLPGRVSPAVTYVTESASTIHNAGEVTIPVTVSTPSITTSPTWYFADEFMSKGTRSEGSGSVIEFDQGGLDFLGYGDISVTETPAQLATLRSDLKGSGGGGGPSGITFSTGNSVVALTGRVHMWTSTGQNQILTLADGVEEQRLTFVYEAESIFTDTGFIRPAGDNGIGFTEYGIVDLGDTVEFLFVNGSWSAHGDGFKGNP